MLLRAQLPDDLVISGNKPDKPATLYQLALTGAIGCSIDEQGWGAKPQGFCRSTRYMENVDTNLPLVCAGSCL